MPQQRAYIPIAAFSLLKDCIQTYNASHVIIVDEFRMPLSQNDTTHIGSPHDLYTYARRSTNDESAYKRSGKNLYYHPLYLNSILLLLKSLGFQQVKVDIDPLLKMVFAGKTITAKRKINLCGTIFATQKGKAKNILLPIDAPTSLLKH